MSTDAFSPLPMQLAQSWLQGLGGLESEKLLNVVFGAGAAEKYYASALFSDPDPLAYVGITLLGGDDLEGHPGAFTTNYIDGKPEIFLNSNWLKTASVDAITGVILEEFGHAIDWAVNGENDTPGDEGLKFSNMVMESHGLNYQTSDRPTDDHGFVNLGASIYNVEFSTLPTASYTTTGITPSNWTFDSNVAVGEPGRGSVDTTSTPTSITINGSAASQLSQENIDYTTSSVITGPGFAVYDWSYAKYDPSPAVNSFGVLLNGSYTQLSSDAAGSETNSGWLNSFFSAPSSYGFRTTSDDGVGGNIIASVSNFKFKLISEAYSLSFNQLFNATGSGTSFNTGALLSNQVWLLADDPTSDSDFTTNFASNGSGAAKRVWLISPGLNNGQPLALYLTNGKDMDSAGAKDLWVFNTDSDGTSGSSYILTSGTYTTTANNTGLPAISNSVALSDLDTLRAGDITPPTVTSVTLSDSRLKIGETTTATIIFSEAIIGLTNANFSTIVDHPNLVYTNGSLTTTDSITWRADFTPSATTEDPTNVVSINATLISDNAGNTGTNTISRTSANYTVDTIRPTVNIFFDNPVTAGLQTLTRPILNGETPYLYFRFREPVYNLRPTDLDVTGGVVSSLQVYKPTLNPTLDSSYVGDEEATIGTPRSTSTLYRVLFTPNNLNSSSIPVWARLKSFSDRAETSATGNVNLATTSAEANLRFSIDNVKPFATFKSAPTSMGLGTAKAIQIELNEASPDFSVNSLKVTGASRIASFRKLSNTLYEIVLVATKYTGDFTLSVVAGSFQDVNGNRSAANKKFLDVARIRAR